MNRDTILKIICAALALLFFYAALSKLIHYDKSKQEMLNQVFPVAVALVLVWLLPLIELMLVFMLLYKPTSLKGLYFSVSLLTAFTIYIAITMSGVFGRIPCSCGGILRHMGYWTHMVFNVFFIVIAVLGIALEKQWEPINRWFNSAKNKEKGVLPKN